MFERLDQVNSPLYAITTIFNPARYRSRWRLYEDFARHVAKSGVKLYTVEVAFGDRQHVITDEFTVSQNHHHIKLVTTHELWLKENALNIAIQRLPSDWKYVAWIDADVQFARDDWANETVHKLQHYDVVQMWAEAADMSSDRSVAKIFKSFVWCYHNDIRITVPSDYYTTGTRWKHFWHPGFAWAMRRSAYDALGGLVDWSILGDADHLMARMLTDLPYDGRHLGKSGLRWLDRWKSRADKHIQGNVGYVDGLLIHHWHGPKAARQYKARAKVLTASHFDPERDLKRDWQGLWQLEGNPKLRDGLRRYFKSRNEDQI